MVAGRGTEVEENGNRRWRGLVQQRGDWRKNSEGGQGPRSGGRKDVFNLLMNSLFHVFGINLILQIIVRTDFRILCP